MRDMHWNSQILIDCALPRLDMLGENIIRWYQKLRSILSSGKQCCDKDVKQLSMISAALS